MYVIVNKLGDIIMMFSKWSEKKNKEKAESALKELKKANSNSNDLTIKKL
jgi:hypothetical protein